MSGRMREPLRLSPLPAPMTESLLMVIPDTTLVPRMRESLLAIPELIPASSDLRHDSCDSLYDSLVTAYLRAVSTRRISSCFRSTLSSRPAMFWFLFCLF